MIKETAAWAAIKRLSRNLGHPLCSACQSLKAECKVGFVRDPWLVYQMGKVGSTTVMCSLQAAGMDNVFHVHYLSGDPAARIRVERKRRGILPDHFYIEQALKRRMRRRDFRCKIITLVRDPIAREISGLFDFYRWLTPEVIGTDGHIDLQRALDHLHTHLESLERYSYIFNWFDNELKEVFGIDVFAHPFDKGAGYTHIKGDKAEVLVLRLEDLSQLLPTVVSDFTGRELDVAMGRRRADFDEAAAYQVVKQNVTVSPEACRRIYDTPFVQHFYSESMIADFIERWSR